MIVTKDNVVELMDAGRLLRMTRKGWTKVERIGEAVWLNGSITVHFDVAGRYGRITDADFFTGRLNGTWTVLSSDPIEAIVETALAEVAISYTKSDGNEGLDFFLSGQDVWIECKQFFSPRIAGQLATHENVIVVQGRQAALAFAKMLKGKQL